MFFQAIQLECLLAGLGILTLLADALNPAKDRRKLGYVLSVLVTCLLIYSFTMSPTSTTYAHGMYRLDAFALYFKRLFLLVTAFILLMGAEFSDRFEHGVAEFYALVMLCATGMLILGSVNDFILLFVALELVTITFYILTSFLRRQTQSLEAGTKYLILGALSSGFTVYGIAYVFGTTGTTNFDTLRTLLTELRGNVPIAFTLGMLMVLSGLGFKIASVPFQIWAPDVYQGAPTPVTAFLAVGSKAAGFAILLRVLLAGLLPVQGIWMLLIVVLSAATLLYGNLCAIPQSNIKRLLGYSSIGHAGYMLMGVAAANQLGTEAVLFYLVQYAFTNLCAFMAIIAVTNATKSEEISSFAGLGRRSPILGLALFLSMASLAGVPPLSGFFAKFQLFAAVIQAAQTDSHYFVLAVIGSVAVVISLYFYFNVARAIYIEEAVDKTPIPVSSPMRLGLVVCMLAMVGIGIRQLPLVNAANMAANFFGLR
jgi:NADH-quinone oxidoreductase subunit N